MTNSREPSPLADVVADAVRRERAGHRLTQEALADRLGVSRGVVADLEVGRRGVTLDDVVALCRALDVSLADLLAQAPDTLVALGVIGYTLSDDDLRALAANLGPARRDSIARLLRYADDV